MAGFATCDKDFPVTEWDRLLDQAELTLNLLRTSRVNPKLSAQAFCMHTSHDLLTLYSESIVTQRVPLEQLCMYGVASC